MSKCMFCKKENDGIVCKHCLAEGATKTGKVIKKSTDVVLKVAPIVITIIPMILTKGKFKKK
ncbi:hypothetical protein [Clostridium butyricum]|uniref:hypothetical protein n=1 Tax=Clostridium butyricum TaxID=1492 RepID=UPI00374EE485